MPELYSTKSATRRYNSRTVHPDRKAISKFHSALAFALTLWCAGAGCMMVSYAHAAAMSNADLSASQSPENGFSVATMGSHDCCKARHSSSRRNVRSTTSRSESPSLPGFEQVALPGEPVSSGATSCCPLTSGSFVVQSRSQSDDDKVLALSQSDSLSFALTNSQIPFRAVPLRLLSQERTYLTCCAFLI